MIGCTALLDVADLAVTARSEQGDVEIVHGVDLQIEPGETVAVVGETGSGKSLTMLALMGLLSPPLFVSRGRILFEGSDLRSLPEREMRKIRGRRMAMIYQDPMTSLNPLMRIGEQVAEGMIAYGVARREAQSRSLELLARVEMPDPERTARSYPHEFSGGMRQRAMIAIALAMRPALLIADEPTTALDVTTQQQIIGLINDLRRELGMATMWVTHDLGVVARLVDRVLVMYGGYVVEDAPVDQLFHAPQHPYTRRLLAALPNPADDRRPELVQIPGRPPLPSDMVEGCPFRPRCDQAREPCVVRPPLLPRQAGAAACWVPPAQWR
ncbi:MAG: ABC transporter ATP-binding protein [Candidatus Limnocylindrales bacterium]